MAAKKTKKTPKPDTDGRKKGKESTIKVRTVKPILLGEGQTRRPGRPKKGEKVVRKVVRRKVPSLRSPVIA